MPSSMSRKAIPIGSVAIKPTPVILAVGSAVSDRALKAAP